MSMQSTSRTGHRSWLWLAACVGACGAPNAGTPSTGTPTPEPPDFLSTPDASLIFSMDATAALVGAPVGFSDCVIVGKSGAVPANASLWLVDLDAPGKPAVTVQAAADGSFSGKISAQEDDRVRIVVRSDRQHSLPLDGVCTADNGKLVLTHLPSTTLSCLELTPPDLTDVLAANEHSGASFLLTNHCTAPVTVQTPTLRFGDQGITIANAPSQIAVGDTGELDITFAAPADGATRADIALFTLTDGTSKGSYALGIWMVGPAP